MKYDINTFAEGLLEAKGLSYLDEQVLDQMKDDLVTRIENRVNTVIATNMPEAAHAEFEKLVDSDASDDTVQKFCAEKIPNLVELVTVELARFQSVYLGSQS